MDEGEPDALREDMPDPSNLSSERVICVFAFAESVESFQGPLPDVTMEQQLLLHRVGGVAALVGVIPSTDYCGVDAARHLSDIAWLAPRARRHAELVEWTNKLSAVFPVPFGTLFISLESLTAFMQFHQATITAFMRSVTNKEEWELRAVGQFDDPETLDELACHAWPDWQKLSKGARYMRLCRDKSALFELGRNKAAEFVRDCVAELRPFASDSIALGPGRCAETGVNEALVRYALLVEKTHIGALKELIQSMASTAARHHIAITLSGPWPPFSFRPDLK
jgi:hypothetical protein